MNDFRGQNAIIPVWKRGMNNCIVNSGSGDYDGGERIIEVVLNILLFQILIVLA